MRPCARSRSSRPPGDPLVSPLHGDLTGLPPLFIQLGSGDRARPEGDALAERARVAGVDVRVATYPADSHVFHVHWSFLPEARGALAEAGEFIGDLRPEQPLEIPGR